MNEIITEASCRHSGRHSTTDEVITGRWKIMCRSPTWLSCQGLMPQLQSAYSTETALTKYQ